MSSRGLVGAGWRPSSRTNASQQTIATPSADHTGAAARPGEATTSDQARTMVSRALVSRPVSGSSAASSRVTRPHTSRMC
ncbi:hypothetical protein ACFQ0B_68320 [Nonomuraea thailandensis]